MLELAARAGLSGRCGRGSARFSGRRIGIYRNDARRLGGRFSADGVRALYSGRIDYPGPACAARREVLASAPRTLLPANDPDEQGSCDHSTHLVRCDAARRRIRFGGTAHWHSGAMDHIWTLERRAFNVRMGSCSALACLDPAEQALEHFSVNWPEERARRQYEQYGEREATQGKSLKNALMHASWTLYSVIGPPGFHSLSAFLIWAQLPPSGCLPT